MEQHDPWALLGVDPGASEQEIRKAYRTAAQIYHPDRYEGSPPGVQAEAQRRMAALNSALQHALGAPDRGAAARTTGVARTVDIVDRQGTTAQMNRDELAAVLTDRLQGGRGFVNLIVEVADEPPSPKPTGWLSRMLDGLSAEPEWVAQFFFDEGNWICQVQLSVAQFDPRQVPAFSAGWDWLDNARTPMPDMAHGEPLERLGPPDDVANKVMLVVQHAALPVRLRFE